MPDTTYTPIAKATRNLTGAEGDLLTEFLTGSQSLEDFVSSKGFSMDDAAIFQQETGVTLPSQGGVLGKGQADIYSSVLQGDQGLFEAADVFGFDAGAAVDELSAAGLRLPLSNLERDIFDTSFDLGFTSEQTSGALGINQNMFDLTLSAAGLNLPGRPKTTRTGGTGSRNTSSRQAISFGGASGTDIIADAFSRIPQGRGAKLGFLRRPDSRNQNAVSGPRGVTESASVSNKKLSARN